MSNFDQNHGNNDKWVDDDMHQQNEIDFQQEETKRVSSMTPSQRGRDSREAVQNIPETGRGRNRRSARYQETEKSSSASPLPKQLGKGPVAAKEDPRFAKGRSGRASGGVSQGEAQQPLSHGQVQQHLYGQGKPNGPENPYKRVPREEVVDERPVAKRRAQPVPAYLQEQKTQPVKTKKGALPVIVIILLIVGFLIVGLAILPKRDTGVLGVLNKAKSAVVDTVSRLVGNTKNLLSGEEDIPLEAKSFIASATTGQAPIEIGFTVTTSTSVQGVRLGTGAKQILPGEISRADNDDSKIWAITVSFTEAFSDTVEVHISDGTTWYPGKQEMTLNIGSPSSPQVWNQEGVVITATDQPEPTVPLVPAADDTPADEPLTADNQGGIAATFPPQNTFGAPTNSVPQNTQTVPLQRDGVSAQTQPAIMQSALPEQENVPENQESQGIVETSPQIAAMGFNQGEGEGTDEEEPMGGSLTFSDEEGNIPADTQGGENDTEPVQNQSPVSTPTLEPTAVPDPTNTPMPYMAAAAVDGTSPDQIGLTSKVYVDTKSTDNFARAKEIKMGGPEDYTKFDNGVLTFRGGPFRQNASFGYTDIQSETMNIAWSVPVGSIEGYSGIYWTGQPAIVQWPKQIREMMKISEGKIDKSALKEVILGAQDGKIYFIDLEDGEETREAIDTGYPLRSSITIHPNSYPLLTVGQGISKLDKGTGKIGYHVYNLIDHKQLLLVNGRDEEAFGSNGAMDGTPVIDRTSDTLIFGGENGLLYTVSLNSALVMKDAQNNIDGKITIEPETVKYRFKAKDQKDADTAIESSVAVYGQYAYFADAKGILQCVDLNTMQPVWAIDTDDNTDASIALDFDEDGSLGLYTVNMVHKQGKKGVSTIRRLDAMTGQQVWSVAVDVKFDSKENGGGKASPIVGKNSIDNMVIFTIAKTTETDGKGGQMLALDKKTGNKIWTRDMETFSWSSPVAVYNEQGNAWILQADNNGMLHMLSGQTGEILSTLELEGQVLASPAVYENMLVIGTTGKDTSYIYGIELE